MAENTDSQGASTEYNPIFEKLVIEKEEKSHERFIGMVAYYNYKLQKYYWRKKNPNCSDEALKGFLSHCIDDKTLEGYRENAEQKLFTFAGTYAESQIKEKEKALKEEITIKEIKKIKMNPWVSGIISVGLNIVSSMIFTFALFMTALLYQASQPNTNAGKIIKYLLASDKYEVQIIEKK